MEYFLIDFENLPVPVVPQLKENQRILIFIGEHQARISSELLISTQPQGKKVEWVKIKGDGKNAIDFHIAFYIGRISQETPKASFHVISRDKGFDPLMQHLNAIGIRCARIERFPPGMWDGSGGDGMQLGFSELFDVAHPKAWPRKFQKLKSYLEDRKRRILKRDSRAIWTTEEVIEKLISTRQIEIINGKICYPALDRIPDWTASTSGDGAVSVHPVSPRKESKKA